MRALETGITPPETEAFTSVSSHEFFPGADEGVGSEIDALTDEGVVLFPLEPKGIGERVHDRLSAAYDFGRDNLRKVALPAVLVSGAIASACGGGESNLAATATVEPTPSHGQTVTVVEFTPTPTATPTEIKPTATPTAKINPESNLSSEAQQIIASIDNITVLTQEQKDAVKAGFSRDWNLVVNETSDIKKISPYIGLYSSLRANYNVTHDTQERELMNQLENTIRVKFPRIYAAIKDGGAFLGPDTK